MFGRYRRLVPWAQRDLIKRHRLGKPNWYVGSAETVHMDRETMRAIDDLKARLNARAASREQQDTNGDPPS